MNLLTGGRKKSISNTHKRRNNKERQEANFTFKKEKEDFFINETKAKYAIKKL